MTVREAVGALLDEETSDPDAPGTLASIGIPAGNWFATNAADDPTRPFIVLDWREATNPLGGSAPAQLVDLTAWVYDDSKDYDRLINPSLKRLRVVLLTLEAVRLEDGGSIYCAEWLGDSADLFDDQFKNITRNGTFRFAATGG